MYFRSEHDAAVERARVNDCTCGGTDDPGWKHLPGVWPWCDRGRPGDVRCPLTKEPLATEAEMLREALKHIAVAASVSVLGVIENKDVAQQYGFATEWLHKEVERIVFVALTSKGPDAPGLRIVS